jgi:hypothetical protein
MTVLDDHQKRRWGTRQRLEFIDFRLFWDGTLNRADIVTHFGVSAVQASADFAQYKKLAPENLDYDASRKQFIATDRFEPKIFHPNADRYLVQLKAIGDDVISVSDTNIGSSPSVDAMPIPHRRVDPKVLRRLLFAARHQRGIKALYHSMNSKRPDPQWREITPHALGFDGLRWHVRAYCHIEARFKDFVLSRILKVGIEVGPGKLGDADTQWQEFFDVVLVPNPELSKSQRETVARDFEMTDGCLRIPIRRALLYYFNKRLRLDVAEKADHAKETPVVLSNKAAFQQALELADF